MAHRWTYIFADLRLNTILGQVPLQQVSFSSQLDGAGTFSAQLLLTSSVVRKVLASAGPNLLEPGRTAIYVDMDGTLVWGGVLWTTSYNSMTQTLQLGGSEFWSYFSQRVIFWTTAAYTNVDQFTIAEALVTAAQDIQISTLSGNLTVGSIGVVVPSTLSGALVSVTFDPSQLVTIAQAFSTITSQSGSKGFDFAIDVSYVSGVPTKTLNLSYPRRGRVAGTTGLAVDVGSKWNVGYTWPKDATQQAAKVYGVGAGTGSLTGTAVGPNRSTQQYNQVLLDGWPLLEAVLQRSDVTRQDIITGLATTYLAARAYPVALPIVTQSLDNPDSAFGSYIIGDDMRLVIPLGDWYFPAGMDEYQRLTAWTVTPGDEGVGTVALTFCAPPVL